MTYEQFMQESNRVSALILSAKSDIEKALAGAHLEWIHELYKAELKRQREAQSSPCQHTA